MDLSIPRHLASVINITRNCCGTTKNELRDRLEISVPTVNKLAHDMEKSGLFLESDGRYQIDPDQYFLVGISVGSAQMKVILLDAAFHPVGGERGKRFKGLLCEKLSCVVEGGDPFFDRCKKEAIPYAYFSTPIRFVEIKKRLDAVFSGICEMIDRYDEYGMRIFSIGLSSTGLVNRERQEIVQAYNVQGMVHETLDTLLFEECRQELQQRGIYVHLEQNSTAAAIAERMSLYSVQSPYRNCRNMASVYLGAGLGSGLILDGRLIYGKSGYAGEIGHLAPPDQMTDGEKTALLRGCEELDDGCVCGKKDCYDYNIRTYIFGKNKKAFSGMSTAQIAEYLAAPEHQLQREILARYLGRIAELYCNLLNIELLVFTGKLSGCMQSLSKLLAIELDKNPLRCVSNDCRILFSDLGVSAPAIGAAISSYYHSLGMELEWT